jgi:hypothetical protein
MILILDNMVTDNFPSERPVYIWHLFQTDMLSFLPGPGCPGYIGRILLFLFNIFACGYNSPQCDRTGRKELPDKRATCKGERLWKNTPGEKEEEEWL